MQYTYYSIHWTVLIYNSFQARLCFYFVIYDVDKLSATFQIHWHPCYMEQQVFCGANRLIPNGLPRPTSCCGALMPPQLLIVCWSLEERTQKGTWGWGQWDIARCACHGRDMREGTAVGCMVQTSWGHSGTSW